MVTRYNEMISNIRNGTTTPTVTTGLYEALRAAVELAIEIGQQQRQLRILQDDQSAIESTFADVMGDLLRDGYWSSTNYAVGQEEGLYWDAYDH